MPVQVPARSNRTGGLPRDLQAIRSNLPGRGPKRRVDGYDRSGGGARVAPADDGAWAGETFNVGDLSYGGVTDYLQLNQEGGLAYDPVSNVPLGQSFTPEGWEAPEGFQGSVVIQGPTGPRIVQGGSIQDVIGAMNAGSVGGTFGSGDPWQISSGGWDPRTGEPVFLDIAPGDLYKQFQVAQEQEPPAEAPAAEGSGDTGNDEILQALLDNNSLLQDTILGLNDRLDNMGSGQGQNDQLANILMAMQMNPGLQGGQYGGGGGYGYGGYGNAAQYGYV